MLCAGYYVAPCERPSLCASKKPVATVALSIPLGLE